MAVEVEEARCGRFEWERMAAGCADSEREETEGSDHCECSNRVHAEVHS